MRRSKKRTLSNKTFSGPKYGPQESLTKAQLSEIQDKIGVVFRNKDLLEQAFVHRSLLNEVKRKNLKSNERLEFLGDKVLGLILGQHLFYQLPEAPQGYLTSIFGTMGANRMLSYIAEELDISEFILMSVGEKISLAGKNKKFRQHVLACTLEALLGAMYLDRGLGAVELFLETFLFPKIRDIVSQGMYISAKSLLQQLAQEELKIIPQYKVLKEEGLDHNKNFVCGAFFDERLVGQGIGLTKAEAETGAAKEALQKEFQVSLSETII